MLDYPSKPLSLITCAYVNTCSRKVSGYNNLQAMGFYNETLIGLQNDSNKGLKFVTSLSQTKYTSMLN